MNKGAKVIVSTLRSKRGVLHESVRYEMQSGIIGTVKRSEDVIGNVLVSFPSIESGDLMDLPVDILQRAKP